MRRRPPECLVLFVAFTAFLSLSVVFCFLLRSMCVAWSLVSCVNVLRCAAVCRGDVLLDFRAVLRGAVFCGVLRCAVLGYCVESCCVVLFSLSMLRDAVLFSVLRCPLFWCVLCCVACIALACYLMLCSCPPRKARPPCRKR